jgi:hypothetical protein
MYIITTMNQILRLKQPYGKPDLEHELIDEVPRQPKPKEQPLSTRRRNAAIRAHVEEYYKNKDGKPYEMRDGQCELYYSITDPKLKYVTLTAPTRYGKSETASIALIDLARFHNLKIVIVGATDEKANKIMEYVVEHIADNEYLGIGLINTDADKLEKLKITTSKRMLRWSSGGWIFITSIDARRTGDGGEKAIGEGADIVYVEESPLIKTKEQFSKIVRMTESDRGWGKLIQAGNMMEGNHFEESFSNPDYYKVLIGLEQAMVEKKWTHEFIDGKAKQSTTKDKKRMYLMQFPKRGEKSYFEPQKYGILPHIEHYFGAMDPALGKQTSSSMTAIVVVGVDANGFIYELESFIDKIKPDDAMDIILNLPYTFTRFGIEAIQFQAYFLDQITAKSNTHKKYIPFEAIQQKGAKQQRIESLEPQLKTGIIKLRGNNAMWDEALDYPDADHLDGLDVLEMAYRLVKGNDWEPAG